jgi:hypothetical protein
MTKWLIVALVAVALTAFGLVGTQTKAEAATQPSWTTIQPVCSVTWVRPNGTKETFFGLEPFSIKVRNHQGEYDQIGLPNGRKEQVRDLLQIQPDGCFYPLD